MKHLLNGVAVAAVLAIAGPALAQQGGNSMGMPGPNPGGPVPYTSPQSPPPTTSATPPVHQPKHPVAHTRAMHAHHKRMASEAGLTGDTTAQLNREELARINSGNVGNPPAPAAPMPEGPPPSPKRLPGGKLN
jgi:hypothetical protein